MEAEGVIRRYVRQDGGLRLRLQPARQIDPRDALLAVVRQ